MDSFEEDMYDDDIDYDIDDDDDHDNDDDAYEEDDNKDVGSKKSYVILKEEDLTQRLEENIKEVTSVLSINKDDACMLLIHYNWSVCAVKEAWFDNEVNVRKSVGLLDVNFDVKFPKSFTKLVDCVICFDSVREYDSANCGCGHSYCKTCWKGYVCSAIDGGVGCLSLKCPEPKCGAVVGPDMVNVIVDDDVEVKKKYERFIVMSYVERSKKVKWCPGPGCEYAFEFDEDYDIESGSSYDVNCVCEFCFCWNCVEDAHRPLDCETVAKWVIKNTAEAENTKWILAYTKPCPECKRSIEKNDGCMHMTCRAPCYHEFCWICLAPYKGHQNCNRYTQKIVDEDNNREMAKKSIVKYTHYYERWAANENSRKKAIKDLHDVKSRLLEKICSTYHQTETQLQFIIDAWLQIIECRRVLKWTYAHGYYIPDNEYGKKNMFEYLQGEAETGLERLHHCAEKELNSDIRYAEYDDAIKVFNEFQTKLTGLTKVTGTYFENLMTALKKGLPEVWSWNADYILDSDYIFDEEDFQKFLVRTSQPGPHNDA